MANRLRTKSLNWQQSNPHLYFSEPVLLGFSLKTLHHADPVVYFMFASVLPVCQRVLFCWKHSPPNNLIEKNKNKTLFCFVIQLSSNAGMGTGGPCTMCAHYALEDVNEQDTKTEL